MIEHFILNRISEDDPYGDSFHTWAFEWDEDGMRFFVDDTDLGSVYPPEGGFWEMGGFNGVNLWEDGEKMAPFDQDVSWN